MVLLASFGMVILFMLPTVATTLLLRARQQTKVGDKMCHHGCSAFLFPHAASSVPQNECIDLKASQS
jgi:hypothetical protein